MQANNVVIVYGSLRKGLGNHYLLEQSEFLGEFITEPNYTMVSFGAFPAVKPSGNTKLITEVYKCNDHTLRALDRLEGFPNFYQKTEMETPWGKGTMYVINDLDVTRYKIVEHGDWKMFHTKRMSPCSGHDYCEVE